MFNILTLNKISKFGLERFDKTKYAYGEDVKSPDAIMVRSASMLEMVFDKNTLAVARAGAGVNNVPCEACTEKGIVVFNTPGANANAVKELVVCSLLLASRKIPEAIDWCKTLKGKARRSANLSKKASPRSRAPKSAGKPSPSSAWAPSAFSSPTPRLTSA